MEFNLVWTFFNTEARASKSRNPQQLGESFMARKPAAGKDWELSFLSLGMIDCVVGKNLLICETRNRWQTAACVECKFCALSYLVVCDVSCCRWADVCQSLCGFPPQSTRFLFPRERLMLCHPRLAIAVWMPCNLRRDTAAGGGKELKHKLAKQIRDRECFSA